MASGGGVVMPMEVWRRQLPTLLRQGGGKCCIRKLAKIILRMLITCVLRIVVYSIQCVLDKTAILQTQKELAAFIHVMYSQNSCGRFSLLWELGCGTLRTEPSFSWPPLAFPGPQSIEGEANKEAGKQQETNTMKEETLDKRLEKD